MKESYWGYWLVMLGILVIGVMLLISSTTTGTTQDYYELKETASASMVDAVDYSYYRLYGDLKISKEKFIEKTATTLACRLSIKANDYISLDEAAYLLDTIRTCENPFTCPHGRPTIITYSNYELERLFKRVMN